MDAPRPEPKTPPSTPDALRQRWLDFFAARDHEVRPSDSLVPANDPTLLFTGAGMNQFKELFLGQGTLPFRRATTIQKCFRQGDLENVGRTPRHLTFFEMMGHFSFGDYFKEEAIAWAWEMLTRELAIPAEKLWISIYEDDEEAFAAWRKVGVARDRIARFGESENFWPASAPSEGPNGPCGPCSEIFYDYGEARAAGDGGPDGYDSGRFVEIWNTVFTQYDRRGPGDLADLPQRNIDCGVGFERVVAVLEGQYSAFGTTLFRPIVEAVSAVADTPYPFDPGGDMPTGDDAVRVRRITDHARAACMLVADGVKPSNEGRGYVLRRILRMAIRDGIQLGVDEPFLGRLVGPVVQVLGGAYPTLGEGEEVLRTVLEGEERRFRETYTQGLRYLEEEIEGLGEGATLPGATAFRLYDTYGFPVDLAARILEERGMGLDRAGFEEEMEAQRERARAGSKISGDIFAGGPLHELKAADVAPTVFLGYEGPGVSGEGEVVGIVRGEELVAEATEGDEVRVILDRTPFYAESGGQVGDAGTLVGEDVEVRIEDTQAAEGYHLHAGVIVRGALRRGARIEARVDAVRRDAIRRNHTATHLLHRILKDVLGEHVRQEGSLVAPDRLRFDFSHTEAVGEKALGEIERRMNAWIVTNQAVGTEVMDLDEAKASGAVAMFGERYADEVRVLDVPGPAAEAGGSRELCGGTHCRRTGDIGSFRITQETSIAAGIRRIEAVTGLAAVEAFERDRARLGSLARTLKAPVDEIADRVEALQQEIKALRKAEERSRREAGLKAADRLVAEATPLGDLKVQVASLPGVDAKALRGVWERLEAGEVDVGVLVGEAGGKAPLLVGCSEAAREAGLAAPAILEALTGVLGGGGGGRDDLAQGQGQDRGRIDEALAAAREALEAAVGTAS